MLTVSRTISLHFTREQKEITVSGFAKETAWKGPTILAHIAQISLCLSGMPLGFSSSAQSAAVLSAPCLVLPAVSVALLYAPSLFCHVPHTGAACATSGMHATDWLPWHRMSPAFLTI